MADAIQALTGDCKICENHLLDMGVPWVEACASVALETGKTTIEQMFSYVQGYHNADHVPVDQR